MKAWRLFKVRDSQPTTLFHGWHGSRTLPTDVVLTAEKKWVRNPGKRSGPRYLSGWHAATSYSIINRYRLARFKRPHELVVCLVYVTGCQRKPRSMMWLAKTMLIKSSDWRKVSS